MSGKIHHSLHIMDTGDRGLDHNDQDRGSADGGNDRAADTRRSVGNDQLRAPLFCQLPGLLADQTDQLARIFLGNTQTGVHHGTGPGLRDIPFAAPLYRKIDCQGRAEIDADPAALTPDGIHLKLIGDSSKATEVNTGAAGSAGLRIDNRLASAHEIKPPPDVRLHQ